MTHYQIHGSEPQENKDWRINVTCHVIANDAMRAMQLALIKHPKMDIFSLNHKGRIELIEDNEAIND